MIQFKSPKLLVFESELFRTTTSLVYTDDLLLVVDPNWLPGELKAIRHQFDQLRPGRTACLLFTHSDYDHIIARNAFADLPVIATRAFQQNTAKEAVIQQILDFDDAYYITRDYPVTYPEVDIIIETDGQSLKFGNTHLCFFLAPGHNADGMFTIVEEADTCLAGDYLSNIEFPYIYHSSRAYEDSLEKVDGILKQFNIQYLVPGHGDVAKSEQEILNRKKESLAYIRELRMALQKGQIFDEQQLWQSYQFPKVMAGFHRANVELISTELAAKK